MTTYLDFEKPIAELESKIAELRHLPNSGDVDIAEEVMRLQDRVQKQLRATYAKLTPWQRVQVARHAERPHAQRYIDRLISDYMPLSGDRTFGEDAAVVGGVGRLGGRRSAGLAGAWLLAQRRRRLVHDDAGRAAPDRSISAGLSY